MANIVVHTYDGARRPFAGTVKWSARTKDGRAPSGGQQTLDFPGLKGGAVSLEVPFFDNFGDLYTVLVNADGYQDSAWYPVQVSDKKPVTLELMLPAKNGKAHFANATWDKLVAARKGVADIVRRGCANDPATGDKYQAVLEAAPDALACFLNITTALSDMTFPSGRSPLSYYWNLGWPPGDSKSPAWIKSVGDVFKQDRFFCYVDQAILKDVRDAVGQGFSQEPDPQAWGHTGATESYKQTQFDVSNVQLTFHGRDAASFLDDSGNRVDCVKIEPDIDYYRDVAAHALIEVIPNWITKNVTDPKVAYALRWMAAKREGISEFDPLYTVE
jgi:hypothetical protein